MVLMDRNLEKGNDKSYETQLFFDMLMMVHVSGKERNQQDWEKLFSDAVLVTTTLYLCWD
ncbi:hypothetical protein H5410_046812 [Solanum commersonii]|uniref:O-methyltransferase C-terminal domain-containing protein n=1 Tax=Solanum commersonii TaxID=4109 RepID=A0A9J5XFE3_SOLCO|nr:hypothetical protein H5410_046812 [Solanum commersonii]